MTSNKPMLLAPAGDTDCFLAALAAGADAIYCGLKIFSARMEAGNFSVEELSRLTSLARGRGVAVYVAFNSLIKDVELEKTGKILKKLIQYVNPHALIIQDTAVLRLAKQLGYRGEIHLSTLGNCSFSKGLLVAKKAGFDRVVLPRELDVDEIKALAKRCPPGLKLELFVHGALCYGVSGRCYWSSWFGGKSGLRGRCVQPCRRIYSNQGQKQRFFSCLDLSIDVLAKVLKTVSEVSCWKIEGRKKSPHYVFYTVKGYRILRDEGNDPQRKKTALAFLEYALGRPATHYNFLPQRPQNPLKKEAETGSGFFTGRVAIGKQPYLVTREPLFKYDLLRIGYEDGKGHAIQRVTRSVPKKGKLVLKKKKGVWFQKGDPVFIVDRREEAVFKLIKALASELEAVSSPKVRPIKERPLVAPKRSWVGSDGRKTGFSEMRVVRNPFRKKQPEKAGVWLSKKAVQQLPASAVRDCWWWLSPVVWPRDERRYGESLKLALRKGAKKFVLNAIWQYGFFYNSRSLTVWAGPFCNIANSQSVAFLKEVGFSGAFASPELGMKDFISLGRTASLPLGIVLAGNWPLAVSRIVSEDLKLDSPFTSPMGEACWATKRQGDFWVFPGWRLNLTSKREQLKKAGFSLFATVDEVVPKGFKLKDRPGLWNWNLRLL